MHIKQVLISGFRSFRSQSDIESFSSKHNVIVGRNGSGKSNFFDAIQFVLVAPKFATLRQEDRQNLLHEGAGSSVMAAYVEIFFDNSDGRFSVDSDEVVLRRTVGHKKDEFFLNRKRIQKNEVISLLESAGFSKSNPYYIVQQGKVANLCLMKDKDRLNLLKEVAGTTVYEERRTESIKIMEETASKQVKVEEVLAFIEERLKELDDEKKELAEYEAFDKQRRALEYNLYDKEFSHANNQLRELETERDKLRDKQQTLFNELRNLQDEISTEEDNVGTLRNGIDRINMRKDGKQLELQDLRLKAASIETELQDIEETMLKKSQAIDDSKKQLDDIAKQIKKTEDQLRLLEPQYIEQEHVLQKQIQHCNQLRKRVDALYGKQGRNIQFHTREERDTFLRNQIDNLRHQLSKKSQNHHEQSKYLENEELRLSEEKNQIVKLEKENESRISRCDDLSSQVHQQIKLRNDLQEQRKNNWRELEQLQEQLHEAKQDIDKGKQQLNRSLPRNISQGIAAVEAIVAEKHIQGYYGPIIDNVSLKSDIFRIPVEVAGGNSLFHIIVDNDQTASTLIAELEKRNAGRLTFLPLNRIRPKEGRYPESTDVRPLMHVALEYEPAIENAIKMVFGSKLLARDLEVAARFSKESKLDCITMEGDVVNHRGAFEGGYYDDRFSKILAVMKIRTAQQKLDNLEKTEKQLTTQSQEHEHKIADVLRSLQKLEAERDHLRAVYDRQVKELSTRKKQLDSAMIIINDGRHSLETLLREIQAVEEQVLNYEHEISLPLVTSLSDVERHELISTENELRNESATMEQRKSEVAVLKSQCEQFQEEIKNSLLKRKEDIEVKLAFLSNESAVSSIEIGGSINDRNIRQLQNEKLDFQMEYDHIQKSILILQSDLQEMENSIKQKQGDIKKLEKVLDGKKDAEKSLNDQLSEANKLLDKFFNKKNMLLDVIQSSQQKIRDLGSVPKKELEEFVSYKEKDILSKLKDVNESLKRYSHVNRKALDQYMSFNEQRDTLLQRKSEMDRDTKAIQQLIQSLDAQKDEAILRTFRGVSQHFSEVFKELVPTGNGKLIMKTSLNGADEEEDFVLEEEKTKKDKLPLLEISTFRGVQVSVSFTGSGQHYQMQQLSGGQKAVVALALIFAIQRCDPAPFYLFDEIDQALDANYRTAIARLIQKQANSESAPAQFITTTFRPELVMAADKCFGIALMNKVSNIYPLEKSDAQDFVTNLMKEEEAVGKASHVPSYSHGRQSVENEELPEEELPRKLRSRRQLEKEYVVDTAEEENEEQVEIDPEDEFAFRQLGLDDA